MTEKRIVWQRPDGGVSVTVPAPNYMAELMASGMTEAEALAVVQAKSVPGDATNIEIMEAATLPGREFRNAWEKPGAGVPAINMAKARDIHAEHIGRARERAGPALDREVAQQRLKGNTAAADALAVKATAARGLDLATIATQIGNAPNPTALAAIWPPELTDYR